MYARVLFVICVLLVAGTAISESSTSISTTSTSITSTSTQTTSTNTLPLTSTIPSGYTYYPATRSFYKLHDESKESWHVANTTCAGEGAHLLVLNDAQEADIVTRIVRDADQYATWTGLRDNRPGGVMDWRTVQGEPVNDTYNVWGYLRPTNNARMTCATFGAASKQLFDWPCDWSRYFMCEISQK